MSDSPQSRPQFRNIHAFKDLTTYRLPLAGLVSILHRISGALLFLLLPAIVWLFDMSIGSEISFARLQWALRKGMGWIPGFFVELVALVLIWAYLHHLAAGVRHLWMDSHHAAVTRQHGKTTAMIVLMLSLGLTVALGLKLFGLY